MEERRGVVRGSARVESGWETGEGREREAGDLTNGLPWRSPWGCDADAGALCLRSTSSRHRYESFLFLDQPVFYESQGQYSITRSRSTVG